jgi:hypothetical protein
VKECVAGNRPAREVSGLKATIGHLLTLAQGDTSTISQTVATTPGDQYSLSFNLANPVSGTPNFFNVTFGNSSFSFHKLRNGIRLAAVCSDHRCYIKPDSAVLHVPQ